MQQPSRFWDRIAERYSKRPVADEAAYQRKLEVTREYFRPEMEVLEFEFEFGGQHFHFTTAWVASLSGPALLLACPRGF
ncbi:MAG: hypothetical protein QNJ30_19405 [Kiloniellales bacterium]|nr:hypothetical protein [Kiloniellales bacterium]